MQTATQTTIKASELRIGNSAKMFVSSNEYVVWQLAWIDIKMCFEGTRIYEPIPLTPEILERCGFDEINVVYADDQPYDGSFGDYKILEYKSRMKNGFYLRYSTKLQYLHQLQNLYHSLTGEELNINL